MKQMLVIFFIIIKQRNFNIEAYILIFKILDKDDVYQNQIDLLLKVNSNLIMQKQLRQRLFVL